MENIINEITDEEQKELTLIFDQMSELIRKIQSRRNIRYPDYDFLKDRSDPLTRLMSVFSQLDAIIKAI